MDDKEFCVNMPNSEKFSRNIVSIKLIFILSKAYFKYNTFCVYFPTAMIVFQY